MKIVNHIVSLKDIFGGIMCAFLATIGIRWTWPMTSEILNLWTETSIMKVAAILSMWLIYFFVLWIMVWIKFFNVEKGDISG